MTNAEKSKQEGGGGGGKRGSLVGYEPTASSCCIQVVRSSHKLRESSTLNRIFVEVKFAHK